MQPTARTAQPPPLPNIAPQLEIVTAPTRPEPALRPEPPFRPELGLRPEPALSPEAPFRPEPALRPPPALRPEPARVLQPAVLPPPRAWRDEEVPMLFDGRARNRRVAWIVACVAVLPLIVAAIAVIASHFRPQ